MFGSIIFVLLAVISGVYFFFFSQKWKDIVYERGLNNLEKGQFDKAAKNFEQASKGNNEADATYRLAVSKYNQKDYGGAIDSYQKAIEKNPSNPMYYNGLGNVYRDQKDLTNAEENYRKAIALDKTYTIAYSNLAIMFMDEGKNDDAKSITDEGLQNNPDSLELKNIKSTLEGG